MKNRNDEEPPRALAFNVALGHRLRRVREDERWTGSDVARRAQAFGLRWDRSTVARIELGQRQVTSAELLVLPLFYGRPLTELLPGETCWLTESVSVTTEALAKSLTRRPRTFDGWTAPVHDRTNEEMNQLFDEQVEHLKTWKHKHFPEAEDSVVMAAVDDLQIADEAVAKAAARLGVDREDIAVAAQQLWQRSFSAERDARVTQMGGDPASRARQARRGHVTRKLMEDLKPVIAELEQARTTTKGRSRGKR